MPLKMKQLPESERPYEKLLMYGAKKLSNAELLAIIIKTGTKEETSVDIANRILLLSENISGLASIGIETLEKIKGIGKVKAIQIKAVCELAIRMATPTNYQKAKIKKPEDIVNLVMEEMRLEKQEILKLIMLNNKNEIIKMKNIALGGINSVNISIKDILAEPIKTQAPKVMLVHNHPSGDATPSQADIDVTKKIFELAQIFNIELLDHIVIGNKKYTSIISEILINEGKI